MTSDLKSEHRPAARAGDEGSRRAARRRLAIYADPVLQAIVDRLILEPASAAQIAAELGIPAEGVRHRLRGLLAGGIVERRGRTRRRGVPEYLWSCDARRTIIAAGEACRLPEGRLAHADARLLRTMLRDVTASLDHGLFASRPESFWGRALLTFDRPGWAEAGAVHRGLIEAIADSVGQAAGRLERGDSGPLRAAAITLLFEAAGAPWPMPVAADRSGPRAARGALRGDRVDALGWAAEPVRQKMLEVLALLPAGAGPRELAERTGTSMEKTRYELRRLADAGLVTPQGHRVRRGTQEVIYGFRMHDNLARTGLVETSSSSSLDRWQRLTVERIFDDALGAIRHGRLRAHEQSSIARIPMRIDGEAFREISGLMDEALDRILDLQDRCTVRLRRSGEEARQGVSAFLLFESPTPATGP